jgi:membrane associated rhomboid family serine protease
MFGRLTPLVKRLLGINIGIAIIQSVMKVDLGAQFGLYSIYADSFLPYQFFTYMFLHGGIMHLLGNMIGLFFFGPLLEQFLGQKKFIILYLAAGLGGGILYWGVNYVELTGLKNDVETYISDPNPDAFSALILEHAEYAYSNMYEFMDAFDENPDNRNLQQTSINNAKGLFKSFSNIPMVGASGAIFGILACFALLFPNTELYLLFLPFPIKAKYLVGFYILYELYSEFARTPGDSVAHLAHLGGALVAYVLIKQWKPKRDSFY